MDWKRRCELIPDGCSTMSKMASRYVAGFHPTEWEGARGARCTAGGKEYVDYTLGLGAVILGYGDPRIREEFIRAYDAGTPLSCPHDDEGRLAEVLAELVPSAEMARFVNTGTEACLAAIKIARAYTGRERILCCGYHGWAPWYTAQCPHNDGCTADEKNQIQSFVYNDPASLERLLQEGEPVAAVILEPYVFELPRNNFLKRVRALCDRAGAVLIFDEVVTALRTPMLTAQKLFGVTPDLTCMGKCITNGVVPMGVVSGKRDLMQVLSQFCFVSSTFAANPLACRMALATIRWVQELGVVTAIGDYGVHFKARFEEIVDKEGLSSKVKLKGVPCRTFFEFPTEEHKSLFWQECLRNGVWFGYAQFVSYAHGAAELDATEIAMRQAMDVVAKNWDHPEKKLEGRCAQATFRLTVHDKKK
jgi:glutamate-1-semialdehyde aminotransferase